MIIEIYLSNIYNNLELLSCSYWNRIGEMFGDIKFWIYTGDISVYEDFDEGIYSDHTDFLDYPYYLETQELADFSEFMNFSEINWTEFEMVEPLLSIDIVEFKFNLNLLTNLVNFINIGKINIDIEFDNNLNDFIDLFDNIYLDYINNIIVDIFYNNYFYDLLTDIYNEFIIFIFIIDINIFVFLKKNILLSSILYIPSIDNYTLILIAIPLIILFIYIKNYVFNNLIPIMWTFLYKNNKKIFFFLKLYVWYVKKFFKKIYKLLHSTFIQIIYIILFDIILYLFYLILNSTVYVCLYICSSLNLFIILICNKINKFMFIFIPKILYFIKLINIIIYI